MESYEDLRLQEKDKIPKLSFFERLFKKSNSISEKNLDFLEERHKKDAFKLENKDQKLLQDYPFISPIEEELSLYGGSRKNTQKESIEEDLLLLDDLILEDKGLRASSQKEVLETQNLESHLEIDEREAILNDIDLSAKEIPFKVVFIAFCFMAIVLALFIPKIYVRNNIYYASRNIIQLQTQIDSLSEENKHIRKQLEDIKFKNLTQELDF